MVSVHRGSLMSRDVIESITISAFADSATGGAHAHEVVGVGR